MNEDQKRNGRGEEERNEDIGKERGMRKNRREEWKRREDQRRRRV